MPSTTNPYDPHVKSLIERHARDAQTLAGLARQTPPLYSIGSALCDMVEGRSLDGIIPSEQSYGVSELSRSISEQWGIKSRGVLVPFDKLLSRDLSTTTSASGGALTAKYFTGGIIDAIRPASAVLSAGATAFEGVVGSKLIIPRWDDGAQLSYVEEGAPADETAPSFDQMVITPRTLCATIKVSRRLLRDATLAGGFEFALRQHLLRAALGEVDRVAITGTGLDEEPAGILHHPETNVIAIDTNGGPLTWAKLAELEETVGGASTETDSTSWVTNSAVRRKLRTTARAAGLDFIWPADDLMGRRAVVTEHVPADLEKGNASNLSAIVCGNFADVVVAFFGPGVMDLMISPTGFNEVKITAFIEVGIGLRRGESFAVCKDVSTA